MAKDKKNERTAKLKGEKMDKIQKFHNSFNVQKISKRW